MDKCAYRYKLEEYDRDNKRIPGYLQECLNCSGYPYQNGCVQYATLDHLIEFARDFMDNNEEVERLRDYKLTVKLRERMEKDDYE